MNFWDTSDGRRLFLGGRENDELAVQAALDCGHFAEDYDEECMAEETVTCYNCRYRRWTQDSFCCMHPAYK